MRTVRQSRGAVTCTLTMILVFAFAACTSITPRQAPVPEKLEEEHAIRLKRRTFVPPPGVEAGLERHLQRLSGSQRAHLIVQFHRVPDLDERQKLERELEVRLLDPIPERAFFAATPPDMAIIKALLERQDLVRWIGRIDPKDKLAPWLDEGIPPHARLGNDVELIVQFFGDVRIADQRRVLTDQGARLLTRIEPLNGWRVAVSDDRVTAITAYDEVKWLEEVPGPQEVDNDGVRSATGVNADAVHPPGAFDLTGAGVTIAQWETTHASAHGDYAARMVIGDPPIPSPARERNVLHDDTVAVGLYDPGEGVYLDLDDSISVSANDLRLTAAAGFPAGSVVAAVDADAVAATPLVGFRIFERFVDSVPIDGAYATGDPLYIDGDNSRTTSAGDARLTPAGGFAAGTVVAAGDPDVGQGLFSIPRNSHYHSTHVAGTALGDGSSSAASGGSPAQWKGVAPGASLRSYSGNPMAAGGAPVPGDEYIDAAANAAALSLNSWGTTHCHQRFPPLTCYESGSQYYDAVISGRRSDGTAAGLARSLLVFGSAGNRGRAERHDETVLANARFDDGEAIYRDADDSGTVSAGDRRLTPVGAFASGTLVAGADADTGTALVNFNLDEAHDDSVSLNGNGHTSYDVNEGIYRDNDSSRSVTAGDLRINASGAFPAGSLVAAADADVGTNLRRFNLWGTVRVPNSAKNTVEVANITSDAMTLSPGSSRGPTDDGRIKPDIAGPGDELGGTGSVFSTYPGNGYRGLSGTSMSTPAVTGVAALIEEWYRQACAPAGASPRALKALLLHGSADLTNIPQVGIGYQGPDFAFGWGRARAKEAVELVPYHREGTATAPGDIDTTFTIGAMERLAVTLVWDDPPWTANAAPSLATGILQNDLDLLLIAPDGTQHTPWEANGNNPFSIATRTITAAGMAIPASSRDRRNTVEQVVVDGASAGTWTARVTASTLNLPPQSYTIVAEMLPASATPCASAPASDVWLMDNPTDVGTVPSTGSMWLGPDPWNRLIDDGVTTHENPEYGQPNYLYATLRNASPVDVVTTAADFWIASASIGLVWPDNFEHVGRLTVPNLTPSEVRQIGPLEWSPPVPTPTSHHCMLVRVESPQDAIGAEGPGIVANAMNNNNIVYRNLTIVNLMSSKTVTVLLRNVEKETAIVDLLIEVPEEFLREGTMTIGLSPALEKSWLVKPEEIAGLALPDERFAVVASENGTIADEKRPQPELYDETRQPPPYRILENRVLLKGFRMGPRQVEPLRITFWSDLREKREFDVRFTGLIGERVFGGYQFLVRTGGDD